MAKVAKEFEYIATDDFESKIVLSTEEFREKSALVEEGASNGVPEAKVLGREFLVLEDCNLYITGVTVPLKEKQKLKDVGQAFKAIEQNLPLQITDRVRITKDTLITDEELAQGFIEAGKPVEAREKKSTAPPVGV